MLMTSRADVTAVARIKRGLLSPLVFLELMEKIGASQVAVIKNLPAHAGDAEDKG